MLENEGTESVDSGVSESPSPEVTSAPSTDSSQTTHQHNASESQPKPDTQTPFHEHPRFKELVEQKNQFAEQSRKMEAQLAEMQRQLQASKPAPAKPADPMLERLKGIDPEFAAYMEKLSGTQAELQGLREWKQQLESDRIRTEAISTVNKLHSENKVPKELQDVYNTMIESRIVKMPNARIDDIPKVFKEVHEMYSKIIDGVKRSERESYLTGKKQDAAIPAPTKGKPVTPSGKFEWSKNPDEARSQMVKRIMKMSKASNEV